MSKTKILLIQIAVCLALGTVLGVSFWLFDGGKTRKMESDSSVGHPIGNGEVIKVYDGRWHKDYLEVIK